MASSTIQNLVKKLKSHDPYTYTHSRFVAKYSYLIGTQMGLSMDVCKNLYIGGMLHDIGKVRIPENILKKQGELTSNEFEIITSHTKIGHEMLDEDDFKKAGINLIALYHHERLNGKGYPMGLKEDAIPLAARIVAVADVYDAMTSDRSYRPALPHEQAMSVLVAGAGTLFDSEVVRVFQEIFNDQVLICASTIEQFDIS